MLSTSTLHLDRALDVADSKDNIPVPHTEYDTVISSNDEVQQHPLGVRPSGNALTATHNAQDYMGLFGQLPDALLLVLLEFLDQATLASLGYTCRGFFAFTSYDQLWRDLAVADGMETLVWRGSWRASLRKLSSSKLPTVDCRTVFSDALHRPFLCSQLPLAPYVFDIPRSNEIARLPDMTAAEFNTSWSGRPFILTEPVLRWQVYEKWHQENLARKYGDIVFRAESVDWPLHKYLTYMRDTQDESPLYLFDRGFVEKMNLKVGKDEAYEPPECFAEDLFTLLGHARPDHRWLIIGPERSGSTFHKDPNATSAWNAVIRGSKYWIMFPNSVMPPGVFMSEDQSEVTSPLSIAEWFLSFHAEARATPGCKEGLCREGEVLHVPSGWWHLVVNLEPAIAITQNFVPRSHLGAAANFLKNKASQVSGFKDDVGDPYALFIQQLREQRPELAFNLEDSYAKKRKWEEVVGEADHREGRSNGCFSFGLGGDIDEDVV